MKKIILSLLILLSQQVSSQKIDTISYHSDSVSMPQKTELGYSPYHFKLKQLIIPSVLISVGIIGVNSDWLKYKNHLISDELNENIDHKITIDDFSQYFPALAVYGLNLCNIKGMHNFRDRTTILATAAIMMGITVNSLKFITKEKRPDGSSRNSFPSGHTAMAFMGAELLWHEFRNVSPWIGITGYTIAAGTGFFRMYNNRHWLTDVLAGAGIGILSTKAAYWLYPYLHQKLFEKKGKVAIQTLPYFSTKSFGLCCSIDF
jgi:hypothetical protein